VIHTYSRRLQDPSPLVESSSNVSSPIETSSVKDSFSQHPLDMIITIMPC
jgi:hypothetical protein